MEDIYIDSSQAYHTQIMHEKYLPTTIYEWPKQVTRQRYDTTLRIETNPYTQSTIEDLLRQTSNYSPSLSVASTAEPSPNFFNDGPQPSPLVTDPTIDKYEIGGTYEALKNITICCARPYLSQPHVKLDFNKAVRPAMVMYDQRYPYDEPKDFESIQWNIVEEHALLMAVVRDQNIRWVDLGVEREHDYVNWLYVAQCVNRIGTTYKSPKQCYIRYVHNIIPREMGKTTVYCCFQRKNRKVNVSGSESQFVKRHGRMKTHAYFMQDAKKTLKVGTAAETKAMIQTKMRQYSDYTNVSRYCDKDKNVVDPHLDSAHLTSYFQAKTPMSVQNLFDDTFHTNDNVNSMLIETKKLAEIEQRKIYENCIGESKRFLKEFKVVGVNKPCLKRVGIISVKENEPGLTGIHEPTVMRAKFSDPSEMERGYRQGQNPLKRPAPGGPIAPITTPQPVAMGGASQMQYRNQNFVGNPNARYPSTNESNVASPQRRVPHQQPRPQPSGPYPGESFNYSNQPSNYMPTNPNIPVVRPQFGTGRKVAPRPVGTAVYNNQPNQQPQTYMRPKHAASFSQEGGGQAPYMLVNANSGQHVQLPPGHNGRVIENRVKAGPTRTLYNAPTAGPPRGPPHPSIKTFKHPSLMLNEPGPSKIGVRGGGVTKKGAQKNTSNPETIIKMNMNLSKGSTIKPPAPRTTLPNRTSRNVAMPMGPVQSSMRQLGMDGSTMGGPSPGQAFTTNYNRNPVPSVPSRQGPGPYSQTQGNRRPHQDLTPSKNQDPNK
uniref:Myb-like domain-containing protein n=1 Tax=Rhabditophanes sp. KR3021 TaxID=114890 RepID=A0AC35UF53_9BILA